jgi:hypothetical protein
LFEEFAGQCLTVARTISVKTDSWRTHEGFRRPAAQLLDRELPQLAPEDEMLAWIALSARSTSPTRPARRIVGRCDHHAVADRLSKRAAGDPTTLRMLASEALIERAVSTGRLTSFEQAVDSAIDDLRDPAVRPGSGWLVAFGAASALLLCRRGFLRLSEDALRAAIEIGENQSLAGVEFGASSSAVADEAATTSPSSAGWWAFGRDRRQPLHHAGCRGRGLPGGHAHLAKGFSGRLSRLRALHGGNRSSRRAAAGALAALCHEIPGAAGQRQGSGRGGAVDGNPASSRGRHHVDGVVHPCRHRARSQMER